MFIDDDDDDDDDGDDLGLRRGIKMNQHKLNFNCCGLEYL